MRRLLVAGVLLVAGAGALPPTAAATRVTDGATFDPEYQWVQPPAEAAAGNTIPIPTTVVLDGAGGVGTVSTADRQLVLRVDAASLPGEPVVVVMTPLAPQRLPALPGAVDPVGNAYRIETRLLDGAPAPVTVTALLVAPTAADDVYGIEPLAREWVRLGPADAPVPVALPRTVVLGAAPAPVDARSWPQVVAIAAVVVLLAGTAVGVGRRASGYGHRHAPVPEEDGDRDPDRPGTARRRLVHGVRARARPDDHRRDEGR